MISFKFRASLALLIGVCYSSFMLFMGRQTIEEFEKKRLNYYCLPWGFKHKHLLWYVRNVILTNYIKMAFLTYSKQMQCYQIQLLYSHFLLHPFQFIVYQENQLHLWANDRVAKQITKKKKSSKGKWRKWKDKLTSRWPCIVINSYNKTN